VTDRYANWFSTGTVKIKSVRMAGVGLQFGGRGEVERWREEGRIRR
jgi:hypothetical protein